MTSTVIIYNELSSLYERLDIEAGAAETHGVVTGLVCGGATRDSIQQALYLIVDNQGLPNNVNQALSTIMMELHDAALRSFNSDGFEFELVLPDDDADFSERTDAVAGWCQGFVLGLLQNDEVSLEHLAEDAAEIVRDMMVIAELDSLSEMVTDDDESQTEERSLTEIEEYLRVGAQLLYEELNPPARTLH